MSAVRTLARRRGDPVVTSVDLERMRVALGRLGDRSAVQGVAMFACSGQSFFETVLLPRPVRDEASFGPVPHLLQLVGTLDEHERFLAVAEALAQGAEVEVCGGAELERFGRIGALERW